MPDGTLGRSTLFSKASGLALPAIWNGGIVFGGLFAAQGLTALSLVLLARATNPEQYALYLASFSLLNLWIVLPGAGLDNWLLIQAPAAPQSLPLLWTGAIKLRVRLLCAWLVCVGLSLFVLPSDLYPPALMITIAVGLASESVAMLNYTAFRVLNRHAVVTLLQVIAAVTLLFAVLVLPSSAARPVLLFAVVRMLIAVAVLIATLTTIKSRGLWMVTALRSPLDILKESWPFLLSDFAVAVYVRADLTLVTLLLGREAASVYGPALTLVNFTFMLPSAIYLLVAPPLSHAFHNSLRRYRILGATQLGVHALAGGALSLLVHFLAPPIVQLVFGSQYSASADMLRHLSLIPFLKALNFGLAALLVTGKQQKQRMRVQIICALFNVVSNLVVITRFGLPAVAQVYTISEVLLLGGYVLSVILMKRRLDRRGIDATADSGSAFGTQLR